MRRSVFLIAGCAALAAGLAWIPGMASAAVYTGPGTSLGSSLADGAGISSVAVTNNATNITFTINSSQPMASYIFYGIELQIVGAPVGDTSLSNNPYTAPNIGISSGVNSLINTYGSGFDSYTWSGSWNHTGGTSYASGGTGTTSATITLPLSQLGLSIGNSFLFDMKLGIDSIAKLPTAKWTGSANDFDADAGIFLGGYRNPYRPQDVSVTFSGQSDDLSIYLAGSFTHADPHDPFGPPKSVQVSGVVHVPQPGK